MKRRFEHVVTRSVLTTDPGLRAIQKELDEMAADGWEFAGAIHTLVKYGKDSYAQAIDEFLIWKRPVQKAEAKDE